MNLAQERLHSNVPPGGVRMSPPAKRIGRLAGLLALGTAIVAAVVPAVTPARAAPEDVVVNEIVTWSPQTVEVWNTGPDPVDLAGFQIEGNAGVLLIISGPLVIAPDEVVPLTIPGDPLNLTGDAIGWLDDFGNPIELVAYGDHGGAPAPPARGSFSLARTGGAAGAPLAANWTVDISHTIGAANDAPAPDLAGDEIVMNEWDVAPFVAFRRVPPQVELRNNSLAGISLGGYLLTNDLNSVTLPAVVLPPGGFHVVDVSDLGMGGTHPNLYLLRDDGVRIDQIGLADAPDDSTTIEALRLAGQTLSSFPDGAGPHDGYDLPTSGGGTTRLPGEPSLGAPNQAVAVAPSTWGRIKIEQR